MPGNSRRDVTVRMRAEVGSYMANMRAAGAATKAAARDADSFDASAGRMGAQIDKLSGRLAVYRDIGLTLGPAAIPITGSLLPAITGLASQAGFAALAGGAMIAAFQGVGDTLKAVNKAALDPTTENLEAARIAMADLSPEARDFVSELRGMIPQLKELRDLGAENMFPGFTRGIDGLEDALPRVERLMAAISREVGDIGGDAGQSLGSERWAPFLDFLADEGPSALRDLSTAVGSTAHALAGMWMAFTPLNNDFSDWLVRSTAELDEWAQSLPTNESFQSFVEYIQRTGPQVSATFGAIVDALAAIVSAAAPLGGPVLTILENVAKVVGAVAGSDLGTPIMTGLAALTLYNRALSVTAGLSARMSATGGPMAAFGEQRKGAASSAYAGMKKDIGEIGAVWATAGARSEREQARMSKATDSLRGNVRALAGEAGRVAGPVAALGVLSTGAADGIGLTNTATLALLGSMGGVPGVIGGAAVGAVLDMKAAADQSASAIDRMNTAIGSGNPQLLADGIAAGNEELNRLRGIGNFDLKLFDFGDDVDEIQRVEDQLQKLRIEADRISGTGVSQLTTNLGKLVSDSLAPTEAAGRAAARGYELTGQAAREASGDVAAYSRAMTRANNAINKMAAGDAYVQSLRDMVQGLRQVGPGLNKYTAAGQQNRAMLQRIASSSLQAAEGMSNLDKRTNFLDRAREDFIGMAQAAGASRERARALADQLGLVDRIKVRPEVQEQGSKASQARVRDLQAQIRETRGRIATMGEKGAAAARARIAALQSQINSLRDRSVTITTRHQTIYSVKGTRTTGHGAFTTRASAEGSTVPKSGLGYADRYPYLLADGEEVISDRSGQATDYRRTLKAINADLPPQAIMAMLAYDGMRKTGVHVGRLAAGGTVGSRLEILEAEKRVQDLQTELKSASSTSSSGSRLEIIEAQARVRDLAAELKAASSTKPSGSRLEINEARQAIREINSELRARKKKRVRVGKGKAAKFKEVDDGYETQGLKRQILVGRRREAERELKVLQKPPATSQLDKDRLTEQLAEARAEEARLRATGGASPLEKSILTEQLKAAQAELTRLRGSAVAAQLATKRTETTDKLSGKLDIFARGTSAGSAVASVSRQTADLSTYGQVVAQLKGAGASATLLEQIVGKAESGDVRSAVRMGQSLLAQPSRLRDLNAQLGNFNKAVGTAVAVTTDPRLMSSAALGATTAGSKSLEVQIQALDVSAVTQEITRVVRHEIQALIPQLGG